MLLSIFGRRTGTPFGTGLKLALIIGLCGVVYLGGFYFGVFSLAEGGIFDSGTNPGGDVDFSEQDGELLITIRNLQNADSVSVVVEGSEYALQPDGSVARWQRPDTLVGRTVAIDTEEAVANGGVTYLVLVENKAGESTTTIAKYTVGN